MSGTAKIVVQAGRAESVVISPGAGRRLVIVGAVVALALVAGIVWVAVNASGSDVGTDQASTPTEAARVAATARYRPSCRSGWVVPDMGTAPMPYTDDKPSAAAVLSSDGELTVTVQGLTGRSVVLQSITVDVTNRSRPMNGAYLPRECEGEMTPRKYRVDLDASKPRLVPEPKTVAFPYKVNDIEPEQFVVAPVITSGAAEWRLILSWTSGPDSGELVVDDAGKPFRTTTASAARAFCVQYAEPSGMQSWSPSC